MTRRSYSSFAIIILAFLHVILLSHVACGFSARLTRPWQRKPGRMAKTISSSTESAKKLARALSIISSTILSSSRSKTTLTFKSSADDDEKDHNDDDDEAEDDDDVDNNISLTNEETSKRLPAQPPEGSRIFIAPPHPDASYAASSFAVPMTALETVKLSIANDKHHQQQQRLREQQQNERKINGAVYDPSPTVLSCLPHLYQMTRPSNFPGVVLFHMLGTYLALQSTAALSPPLLHTTTASTTSFSYWSILLRQPLMWVTLVALLLTDATSMVVNDYYDNKLGLDSAKSDRNRLVSGQVPMEVAKRFLSYLYAAALVCVAFVPGVPGRLSILTALMFTFWYTKHLKPITWLKNVVCASLIALSPFTSGSVALQLLSPQVPFRVLRVGHMWRLVAMLFAAFLGREIMMDCNDVVDDRLHRVRTVPVKYGRKFASAIALGCTSLAACAAILGPLWELRPVWDSWTMTVAETAIPPLVNAASSNPSVRRWILSNLLLRPSVLINLLQRFFLAHGIRRFVLASLGSLAQVRRAWQVYQTEGENKNVVDQAVEEGKLSSLLLLASFL